MEYIKNHIPRISLNTLSLLYLCLISVFNDFFKQFPLYFSIPLTILIIILNIISSNYDVFILYKENILSKMKETKLSEDVKRIKLASDKEITELKNIIIKFIDKGIYNTEKIREKLFHSNNFICIAKSSEGLSKVFIKLKEKNNEGKMLPFTKVLSELPSSVKPFERMGLFLIPVKPLSLKKNITLKEWMNSEIIPNVKEEREKYLNSIPKSISKLADPFSFKYIAFYVNRDSLVYDFINRKFSIGFTTYLINNQNKIDIAEITEDFNKFIRAKEFIFLIDWSIFLTTDKNKTKILGKNREKISHEFEENNLCCLIDIANADIELITSIFHKILKRNLTLKKCKNLAKRLNFETNNVITILRKTGVKI